LTDEELTDPNLWIKIWDDVPPVIENYPAFYFPRLPARLTGLSVDLTRLESSESAVRPQILDRIQLRLADTDDPMIVSEEAPLSEPSDLLQAPQQRLIVINNEISPVFGSIVKDVPMEINNYTVNGPAGAVGTNASSYAGAIGGVPGGDSAQLATELLRLRDYLNGLASSVDEKSAVAAIESAAEAVAAEDATATAGHLRRAGRWALSAATTIGTGVAAAAIKAALGV
jgi:hypothetical protein